MARLGRTQLRTVIPLVRAPQRVAHLQGSISGFEITTNGSVSFPVPAYLSSFSRFEILTNGQIVKRQEFESTVDIRIGATAGQAYPVGLLLAITDPTRGLTYQLDRSLTVTATSTASNADKDVIKGALVASSPVVPTVRKGFFWSLTTTSATVASLIKQLPKTLSTSSSITATNTRLSVVERLITTSVTTTASLSRLTLKVLSRPVTTTSSFVKNATKSVTTTVSTSPSIVKLVSKSISRAIATGINFAQNGAQSATMLVTVTALPTIEKLVTKSLTRAVSVTRFLTAFAPNAPVGTGRVVKVKIPYSKIMILENTGDELSLLINTEDKVYLPK